MKRILGVALSVAALAPALSGAQTAPSRSAATAATPPADGSPEALPPGHPPLSPASAAATAGATSSLPAGHPPAATSPTAAGEALPEGHPRVDAVPDTRGDPIPDRVVGAPDLAPGTVEVIVRDERDAPVVGTSVELAILRHDIAQGDSTKVRRGITDADGRAVFRDNPRDTIFSYRASLRRAKATFASPEFQLVGSASAQRVLLHSYPSSASIREVLVGMRGLIAIQPREDVFQVEATFDIFNIGRSAWVPQGVKVAVPSGAKAIRAREEGSARLVADDGALRFAGTFGPGRHQVGYSFQIENAREPDRTFRVPLPPQLAELRIVSEAPRGLSLDVDGFPEAERFRGQTGAWLLMTGKQMVRGDQPLSSVEVSLRGLPVPSSGRWYAVAAAVAVAATGVWSAAATRRGKKPGSGIAKDDVEQARRLLLDELVLLERLRARDEIGPRTYQSSREALLDALGRLESEARGGTTIQPKTP